MGTPQRIRRAVHVLLFLLAAIVFYLGLGVGLQLDPNLGTVLWAAAGAIVVLNLVWMRRSGG